MSQPTPLPTSFPLVIIVLLPSIKIDRRSSEGTIRQKKTWLNLIWASISINQHQFASISIYQHQSAPISINQHQSTSISRRGFWDFESAHVSLSSQSYWSNDMKSPRDKKPDWRLTVQMGHSFWTQKTCMVTKFFIKGKQLFHTPEP